MSMTTQTYQLDIVPFGPPVIIPMSQYDTGSRTLAFTLYNAQQPFTIPDGATAMIGGTKPDGHAFEYICTVTDQTITCDVTEQMTAVAGYTDCEITLSKDMERLATANFKLHVERSALDRDAISDSDFTYVLDLTNTATAKASEAAKSATAAAGSATAAADKASDAASSAKASADSATAAQGYAGKAASSATEAAKSATAAAGSATAAADKASDAASSAKASADSATAAQGYAGKAASSATEAQGYADSALTAATNAAGYAGEAEYRLMIDPDTGCMALAHYNKEA